MLDKLIWSLVQHTSTQPWTCSDFPQDASTPKRGQGQGRSHHGTESTLEAPDKVDTIPIEEKQRQAAWMPKLTSRWFCANLSFESILFLHFFFLLFFQNQFCYLFFLCFSFSFFSFQSRAHDSTTRLVCPSVRPSVRPSVHLFVHWSVKRLSVFTCVFSCGHATL